MSSSYKQILKATSLFGGVQFVTALTSVVKTKAVALLLGVHGVGIYGLVTSTLALINSIANMGLQQSATREVAAASPIELPLLWRVVQRITYLMGLLALLFTLAAAPLLSQWVFGNSHHTVLLRWLSLALFFDQLTLGQMVLLQGLRRLNYLAKANIMGSLLGAILSIPCYWMWGIGGIAPAVILCSVALFLRALFFTRKLAIPSTPLPLKETLHHGGGMVRLGVVMSLTSFIALGATYVVRLYVSHRGGVEQVGYYNAAFVVAESYVGMVFTAMATDFFPRLTAVHRDNRTAAKLVNEQAEIALILLLPALLLLLSLAPWVIRLLYAQSFLPALPLLRWLLVGALLKGALFPFDYLYIAKGSKRIFLLSELFSWTAIGVASLLGYRWGGLGGVGMGYTVGYLLSLGQSLLLNRYLYNIRMERKLALLLTLALALLLLNLWSIEQLVGWHSWALSLLITLVGCGYSYRELTRRVNVWDYLRQRLFTKK